MPQRTNDFQTLITKIQAALHGKKAKVEESAMVYNYDTEKDTEIDILITFELGTTLYRTGIECQDRKRAAGSDWIAQLKAKRDGCRINTIIAIHSKGFSNGAIKQAEKYGIELITPEFLPEIDWKNKFNSFTSLAMQTVRCKLRNNELLFSLEGKTPKDRNESTSFILIPGESGVNITEFIEQVRECIKSDYQKRFDLGKKPKPDFIENQWTKTIDLVVTFPEGTILKPTVGEPLDVITASGVAEIIIDTVIIDDLKYIKQKEDTLATHADFELMGHKASVTLTEQKQRENEMGICLSWDGGQFNGPPEEKDNLSRKVRVHIKERS